MACREAADGGRICAATITFAASRPELHVPMFSECRLFGPVTGGEGPSISLPGFTSWACWMLGGGMADPAWPGWCVLLRLLRSRGVCCRGSSGGRAFVSALLFGLRRVVARPGPRGGGGSGCLDNRWCGGPVVWIIVGGVRLSGSAEEGIWISRRRNLDQPKKESGSAEEGSVAGERCRGLWTVARFQ